MDLATIASCAATTAAGALLLGLCYRWRGLHRDLPLWPFAFRAPWLPRRLLCGALIAVPALARGLTASIELPGLPPLALGWELALALYAVAAGLSTWTVGFAHGAGLSGERPLFMARTGLAYTAPTALALALLFDWIGVALLAAGGLLKGALYLLPRGTKKDRKFLRKELGFGSEAGAAAGLATGLALFA